jgi:hypothetical protein
VKWIKVLGHRPIPVARLESLHHDKKIHFVSEASFQGPEVVIYTQTAPNSHGRKHRFPIYLRGEIFKDDEGKRFFRVEKARYLMQKIPQSLRFYYNQYYTETIKENIDRIFG